MVERIGWLLVIGALGLAAITGDAVARSQFQASQKTGSGRITGRVVAADDGKPVRRVEVQLSGQPDSEPDHVRLARTVETDLNGRFEFVNLPAGDYGVFFNRLTGFVVPSGYGYRHTRLTESEPVDLTIRLERTGAIEGVILDDDGDPVLGAEVIAVDRVNIADYVSWGTRQARTVTNDRGEFRVFNLAAGDYYLVALKGFPGGPHQPPPPPVGYVTTYYPGSTRRMDARAVTVRAAQDTRITPFKLARRNLATVSILAIDSRGAALGTDARAHLGRPDALDLFSSTQITRYDGANFVFRGVEPGEYSLIVSSSVNMEEQAYLKISIDQKDVSLKVQTNTGARVSGRVIVDGRPAEGGLGLPNVRVSARTPSRTYGFKYSQEPSLLLRGTDRFELTGLRGPMQLSGDVTYGKLVSIRRGGEELSWKTINFAGTETLDDVVVDLTTRVAKLEVMVPRSSGSDEILVFIFPGDRQHWRPGLAIQVSVPVREGLEGSPAVGSTSALPFLPGRYLVVAVNSAAVLNPADTALLDKLAPLATPLDLTAGETRKITIPVANTQR
jgi:hypothetical protein